MQSSPATITVQVKFAGRSIPVAVPASASAGDLKRLLQPLTNVLPRGQKLIFKGTVLADAASLSSVQLVDGSKLMLIAAQGVHQGDGPTTKNGSGSSSTSVARRASNVKDGQTQRSETVINKSRSERWKLTGVVALSECQLKVPDS